MCYSLLGISADPGGEGTVSWKLVEGKKPVWRGESAEACVHHRCCEKPLVYAVMHEGFAVLP